MASVFPPDPECPLRCGSRLISGNLSGEKAEFRCPVCGGYRITKTVLAAILPHLNSEQLRLLPYLRAHARQTWEAGGVFEMHSSNWEDVARAHVGIPVPQKLIRLLAYIGDVSEAPGAWVPCDLVRTAPLMDCIGPNEVQYLLDALVHSGALEKRTADDPSSTLDQIGGGLRTRVEYRVTPSGWETLTPISGAGRPGTCLVAMAFDKSLDPAYDEGIKPAVVDDSHLEVIRVDRVQFNESITDKIIVGIRTAQFVVADVTLQRNGVYFEAGYAMGLGRPVIWTVREDDLPNVHFDTRQYNHIVWKDPRDLREKLATRIQATIPMNRPNP